MSLHTRDDIDLGRSYDDIELRGLKIKSNPLHAFSTKQRSPTYLSMIKRTALQVINQILAINGRGHTLSVCIASILISAFILLMLRPAVAVAATFDNEISYFSGSKQVTSTRVLYTYPDTATTDKPMNVSVIIRYLNNTYAIPKWKSAVLDGLVHGLLVNCVLPRQNHGLESMVLCINNVDNYQPGF